MKFREEILSKIFTYITVILLLGIVIFEAWSLQGERSSLKQAQEEAAAIQQNLDTMIGQNAELQEENRELQIFQNTWISYAAFVDSSEVLTLKTDLFVRPDLIPEEALAAAHARYQALLEQEAEAAGAEEKTDSDESTADAEESAEERKLEFQFDNPNGEDIFFPLSIDSVRTEGCLVYTVAFEKNAELSIELVYELRFENENDAVRDEHGEVEWNCIAYNAGDGWQGMEGDNDDQN